MADIYINYGLDPQSMTLELLRAANLERVLRPGMKVCIKPNLVVSRPAAEGATTHPEIAEGVIVYLRQYGIEDITIAEGSWMGDSTDRAFANCGYEDLARRYGIKLLDTKKDHLITVKHGALELLLCQRVAEADFLINLPVLKGHGQTLMTCCLKNMKGCIPDREKRRYHTIGLHQPIAALNLALKPGLHIIDNLCGDPVSEEGGNPLPQDRILLGFDPVLLDSYCARLLGYHPEEIGYLNLTRQYGRGGFADENTAIVEINADKRPAMTFTPDPEERKLAARIEEDSACSACYAALLAALRKTGWKNPPARIKIGQGYKGRLSLPGLGIGNCASGCQAYVPGCPPSALAVMEFLQKIS
jgi:uncharacterized protein (DUF362 family)